MRKSLAAVIAIAFMLAGCATTMGEFKGYREFGVRTLNVTYASVQVVNDQYVVVSQEPIFVEQDTDNAIYWSLPPGGPYYFLPKTSNYPGIVFDRPQMPQTDCYNFNGNPQTYVCTYKKANKAKYPYTIQVTKDGSTIVKSDPTVRNN